MLYPEATPESSSRAESVFAWLTVATGALVVLFLLGSFRSNPGIALGVALCTGPALLATALLIYARQANGKPFSWQNTFAMFAGSLSLMAIVLASVVAVVSMMVASFLASVGGVCTICAPPAKQQGTQTSPLETPRWD